MVKTSVSILPRFSVSKIALLYSHIYSFTNSFLAFEPLKPQHHQQLQRHRSSNDKFSYSLLLLG